MSKNVFTPSSPMAPPWLMFPALSRHSIGWRMGCGESYLCAWSDWIDSLSTDERARYIELFPEPKTWRGFWADEPPDEGYYMRLPDGVIHFWQEGGAPEYAMPRLIEDCGGDNRVKYLPFYGHKPSADGGLTRTCLSQWWMTDFREDHNSYCCMEQYMMAGKARIFGDDAIFAEIMSSDQPKAIKAFGRAVTPFDPKVWDKAKYSIVLNGNYHKFMQNRQLREFLLSTGDRVLVEASPFDGIWGIRMSATSPDIEDPTAWKGENLLGFALMEVRRELARICANEAMIDFERLAELFVD